MAYRSRQRVHGGGKFKSERQRRAMWKFAPSAARRWAHNVSAKKDPSWKGMNRITSARRVGRAAARGPGKTKRKTRPRTKSRRKK